MGVEVDINDYIQYIKDNPDIILHMEDGRPIASVLDAIGDAHGTFCNQRIMEQAGVTPLPCFHYGEDEKYLEWYVENYPYITIGGMVAQSNNKLIPWLDRIWDRYLTDSSGRAKIKVHGFGMTSVMMMERYPWYSVDSSSWVQASGNGSIMLVGHSALAISDGSPMRKANNQHYDTIAPALREKVKEIIEKLGFDVERLHKTYIARWTFNLHNYTLLNEKYANKDDVFVLEQEGLF
jgi:hypothetical protein